MVASKQEAFDKWPQCVTFSEKQEDTNNGIRKVVLSRFILSDEINECLKGYKKSKELCHELLFQKIGGFINGESLQFEKDNIRDGFKRELPVPQGIEAETYPPGDYDCGIVVLVKDGNICVSELNLTS